MRMLGFYLLYFLLPLLGLTVAGQEAFELIHLHEPNPSNPPSIAVSVSEEDLPLVSSSVLAAEAWLKSHVLAHFPSTNITTIVVGRGILCNKHSEHQWNLILPSVKNIYYSLTRWGLVKEIKVSAAFSSNCFGTDAAQNTLKPLLSFLQASTLPYSIYPPRHSSLSSLKTHLMASIHLESLEKLGFSGIGDIRIIKGAQAINRKLSSLNVPSFSSPKTNLLVSIHQESLQRLVFSSLRDVRMIKEIKPLKRKLSSLNFPSRNQSPPTLQFAPVPDSSFSFAPDISPTMVTASPPTFTVDSPPVCVPAAAGPAPAPAPAPAPGTGEGEKGGLWCVAKPTVPAEKLQEAMDYACGEGGADCEEIRPNGNCFNPDNLVAHASYAFNSYWQKRKQSGGSCSFDGTAILINSDPSFLHCRFDLN